MELPAVLGVVELGKAEVMSLGVSKNCAVNDHASGDVEGRFPAARTVQSRLIEGIFFIPVHKDVQNEVYIRRVRAFPLFLYRHRGGRGSDRRRIFEFFGDGAGAVAGVGVGDGTLGVGLDGTVLMKISLKVLIHDVVIGFAVIEAGLPVQRRLAGIDVKGHGVGDAIQQHVHIGKVPFHRAVDEFGVIGGVFIKVVGEVLLGPFELELAVLHGAVEGDRFVCPALGPGNRAAVDGIGDLHGGTVDVLFALELVVAVHGDAHPVLVGAFIDAQKRGDLAGAGGHRAGGTVAHGNLGDAHGLNDLIEDLSDSSLKGFGIIGVVILLGAIIETEIVLVLRGSIDRDAIDGPVGAGVGVVQQVVQQVGIGSERINAVERGVFARLDTEGFGSGNEEVPTVVSPGHVRTGHGGAIAASDSGTTVGDEDHKGRVVGTIEARETRLLGSVLTQEVIGQAEGGGPCGTVMTGIRVGARGSTIDTFIE